MWSQQLKNIKILYCLLFSLYVFLIQCKRETIFYMCTKIWWFCTTITNWNWWFPWRRSWFQWWRWNVIEIDWGCWWVDVLGGQMGVWNAFAKYFFFFSRFSACALNLIKILLEGRREVTNNEMSCLSKNKNSNLSLHHYLLTSAINWKYFPVRSRVDRLCVEQSYIIFGNKSPN